MNEEFNELKYNNFIPTAEIIKQNYGGREIVLYGDSSVMRELLNKKYGIETNIVATGNKETASDRVKSLLDFSDRSQSYYIVVPFLEPNDETKTRLTEMGYKEFEDFVFALHKPIISDEGFEDYRDPYGNHINAPKGVKIIVDKNAGGAEINIDSSAQFGAGGGNKACRCFRVIHRKS